MATPYLLVLIAALLPYALVLYAKMTPEFLKERYNKNPRDYEEGLVGARRRAYWAHLNGFEAFPPFAAAVIVSVDTGVDLDVVNLFAGAFVVCRVAHGIFYIANLDILRSIFWAGGLLSVIALFVLAGT